MFTVYGLAGRVVSGDIEQLARSDAVQSLARVRAATAVGRGAEVAGAALERVQAGGATPFGGLPAGIRQALAQYEEPPSREQPLSQVRAVMSSPAFCLPLQMSIDDAWQALQQRGLSQAPVLGADGRPVGLLLRGELLPPSLMGSADLPNPWHWQHLLTETVQEHMLSPVPCASPQTSLRQLAHLLLELHLPGLPVLDEAGAVQGFVSRSDLLKALVHEPPLDLWG